jgi:hypothetical protein
MELHAESRSIRIVCLQGAPNDERQTVVPDRENALVADVNFSIAAHQESGSACRDVHHLDAAGLPVDEHDGSGDGGICAIYSSVVSDLERGRSLDHHLVGGRSNDGEVEQPSRPDHADALGRLNESCGRTKRERRRSDGLDPRRLANGASATGVYQDHLVPHVGLSGQPSRHGRPSYCLVLNAFNTFE